MNAIVTDIVGGIAYAPASPKSRVEAFIRSTHFDRPTLVLDTGIVVLQYPNGVEWPNGTAHLVVGLAARGDDHVEVLSQLAEVLQDEDLCHELWATEDPEFVYQVLTGQGG